MRVADGFARNSAQAESLIGGEIAGLQASIVEDERFLLAIFEEQFAIVSARQRIAEKGLDPRPGDVEAIDQRCGHAHAFPAVPAVR